MEWTGCIKSQNDEVTVLTKTPGNTGGFGRKDNMKINWSEWTQLHALDSKSYTCGYCGQITGTSHGYYHRTVAPRIYICTFCGNPTYFNHDMQIPGSQLGREIKKLPPDISQIYNEVRDSIKNRNFTGAELLGRKLIMHLAVDKAGAPSGRSFMEYVQHLKDSGYIPPNGDKWLEYVRKLGNEQNHEIKIGKSENCEKLLKFVEILLIFIYEFSGEFDDQTR